MPLIDKIRENKLIELTKTRFDPKLTPAELKVLHDSASSEDLPDPGEKATPREVRAAFLRWLATDPEAAPNIDPNGLLVYAATIAGKLDLSNCHLSSPLVFRRCKFVMEFNIQCAETKAIQIVDSSLEGGIHAEGVNVRGPLFLQRIQSHGGILLNSAEIAGQLNCTGAQLEFNGSALNADSAKIGGHVLFNGGFLSKGEICILGAEIGGQLICNGAKLLGNPYSLVADGARIRGGVH